MAIIESTDRLGDGLSMGEIKHAVAEYDFAKDGGAVSTINLRGDSIPSGAIIVNALIDVRTIPTSGGAATIALNTEGAGDIQVATSYNASPYSTATPKRGGAMNGTATPIKTTAKRPIQATIAAAALTAGKFKVLVSYLEVV